jgi:hypothetical protein
VIQFSQKDNTAWRMDIRCLTLNFERNL